MGLCVGFSFMDCVNLLFKLVEVGVERINKKWFNNGQGQVSPVINQELNITTYKMERLEHFEHRVETILKELKTQQDTMQAQLQTMLK